jgi:hypothetical protein
VKKVTKTRRRRPAARPATGRYATVTELASARRALACARRGAGYRQTF